MPSTPYVAYFFMSPAKVRARREAANEAYLPFMCFKRIGTFKSDVLAAREHDAWGRVRMLGLASVVAWGVLHHRWAKGTTNNEGVP